MPMTPLNCGTPTSAVNREPMLQSMLLPRLNADLYSVSLSFGEERHEPGSCDPLRGPANVECPLSTAISSCALATAKVELAFAKQSIPEIRRAFACAEQSFEELQHHLSSECPHELSSGIEADIADLGRRLDSVWLRLVCAFW
jgi:hypothetical protein